MTQSQAADNITFRQTMGTIRRDNQARMVFMEKPRTVSNRLLSYLSPNMAVVIIYRLSHWAFCKRLGLVAKFLYYLNLILFGCEITPPSVIGPGLVIGHVVGVAIHGKIGAQALFYGQNGVGGRGGGLSDSAKGYLGGPIVGDHLTMGYGSKLLVTDTIGKNVFVAAMSLVTTSVPDNAFMAGMPAKIKKYQDSTSNTLASLSSRRSAEQSWQEN